MTDRKLGRLPVRTDPRTLQLARYVNEAALPPVPLHRTAPAIEYPMYGNDRLGDCTIAAAAHMVEVWEHWAKRYLALPKETAVELAYWETGSPPSTTGIAGGPTDTGRVELDVLNYWRKSGIGGDHITAYVAISTHNVALIKAAIYLFGGVYIGIDLPVSAQDQTEWKVVAGGGPDTQPGSWGGHAIPYVGYTSTTFTCVTWGELLHLTQGFHLKYAEEAYAILSPDFLANGLSPAGFNQAALMADLQQLSH